ncbi:MAG: dynamin family protein [Microgenomates group bacterium]|nr:dynamin family protein [Microgenomates group bacterium]
MNLKKIEKNLDILIDLPLIKEHKNLFYQFNLIKEKLGNRELQIVVLGQFKRGKTSLINSLIGKKLLPTSVVPLTSVITILKYGQKSKALVKFLDGRNVLIEIKDLENYITEEKNPKNIKKVDKVIIEYPSLYLKDGVQIIDTPGVGSVYEHNTDVAYQFVPQADVGIFVVTADPPISEAELSFLSSIKNHLGKIIFIQNKIDQVEKKDWGESLEFTKKIIKEKLKIKKLKIYPLSSKTAIDGKLNNDKKNYKKADF